MFTWLCLGQLSLDLSKNAEGFICNQSSWCLTWLEHTISSLLVFQIYSRDSSLQDCGQMASDFFANSGDKSSWGIWWICWTRVLTTWMLWAIIPQWALSHTLLRKLLQSCLPLLKLTAFYKIALDTSSILQFEYWCRYTVWIGRMSLVLQEQTLPTSPHMPHLIKIFFLC